MKRLVVLTLAIGALIAGGTPAWSQRADDDDDDADRDDDGGDDRSDDDDRGDDDAGDRASDDDDGGGDDGDADDDDGKGGIKPNAKAKAKAKAKKDDGDDGGGGGDDDDNPDFDRNQDHTRPGGGRADQNSFQRERFFVDKEESAKTAKSTLFQGSLTSSSFYYRESGGDLGGQAGVVGANSNSQFSRMFTDLRSQLDALHMGGSRFDFRLDGRVRFLNDPGQATTSVDNVNFPTRVQSGTFGRNEYELRELWLVRGGARADVFVGRQYITDLGAIKIDGVRIDYAQSTKLTLLGFVGAYPLRGSRSVRTDYLEGRDSTGAKVGRVIPVATGGGAAYRTEHTYGSFGGVAIVPLKAEQPRVYATANGYWRTGPKLDFYHFVVLDLYGSAGFALTNLSLGINAKPAPRIRLNAAVNRVDTETLNVTAQSFLNNPDPGFIRNDTQIQRVASDQARGGISVALGGNQQIEIATSLTYRRRPKIVLSDGMALTQTLAASSSVEVLFQLLHRSLYKGIRVGFDGSRIFKVGGGGAYARSDSFTGRLFLSREFKQGRGEWEAEVAYTAAKDLNAQIACDIGQLETCYGSSRINLYELGGSVYYRLRDSLFLVAVANVGRYKLQSRDVITDMTVSDAPMTSLSGILRLAYRF